MSASVNNPASSSSSTPSMNWEPVRKKLLSEDVDEALRAATELRNNLEIVHTTEFPLMLSALLPAFTTVILAPEGSERTLPSADVTSSQHRLRNVILDMIHKMPTNEVLRPHAPHLVALALDVLRRDYEDNSLLASKIIFDLYKAYRSLPQEHVQPYFDLVVAAYRTLPLAVQHNFTLATMLPPNPPPPPIPPPAPPSAGGSGVSPEEKGVAPMDVDKEVDVEQKSGASGSEAEAAPEHPPAVTTSASAESTATLSSSTSQSSPPVLALRSSMSLRVLTESPLIVMLMLQLYPSFLKTNIPVLIKVMMEALVLRAPSLQAVMSSASPASPVATAAQTSGATPTSTASATASVDPSVKRLYYSRSQQLVAAQAKTLSFVTYLLRSFAAELKPYEERLAGSVVSLMAVCPRESLSTRKELLVATRHVLNSEFRRGFYRHADSMLDERVLLGSGSTSYFHRFSDQALLRPLAYTTLSDYVQNARSVFTMKQMSRVVLIFSRVLHDSSGCILPMSTQYTAVRTLLSLVELIFQNKDPNPQLGRDLLVRMLQTLVDKLEALVEYFPTVLEEEQKRASVGDAVTWITTNKGSSSLVESIHSSTSVLSGAPPDSTRDVQIMVRAIIIGNKTLITCLHGYRSQREKLARSNQDPSSNQAFKVPPPGPNDEVSSGTSRLTHTEVAIIDRYIVVAFKAAKLQKDPGQHTTSTTQIAASTPTNAVKSASAPDTKGTAGADRAIHEHHRDSLTHLAAAFATMDGIDLAKTLGRRLDLLVDAITEDPIVMVIPRHLLGTSATISFEFCALLLDHIVNRMDDLACGRDHAVTFLDAPGQSPERESFHKGSIQQIVRQRLAEPPAKDEQQKSRSSALLQLFERILKSLSVFPGNESIVRRHLRRIVVWCLRSSMEDTQEWPDNYCMLLRYVFRSISAGKFEESYKELLPLIPTVLNGLFRVMTCSKDTVIRYTAVELCLTIPARLSSLLPHMNLLLRVIIPALDSNSGDLVNLGLRTLEFWVDNLNPLFLVPEISKQTEVFTSLMQSLSRHLRPAPYPYGLLTLRLLGKLGGKNRQFLREPFVRHGGELESVSVPLACTWDSQSSTGSLLTEKSFELLLPLDRCLFVLRMIATARNSLGRDIEEDPHTQDKQVSPAPWQDSSLLMTTQVELIDMSEYQQNVLIQTKREQADACTTILHAAARLIIGSEHESNRNVSSRSVETLLLGLMYASMVDENNAETLGLLKSLASTKFGPALRVSLADIFCEADQRALSVGTSVIQFLVDSRNDDALATDVLLNLILSDLCKACATHEWGERTSLYGAILFLIARMQPALHRKNELEVMTTAFVSVKSVPQEIAMACSAAIRFFCGVCVQLYGKPWSHESSERHTIWDSFEMGVDVTDASTIDAVDELSRIRRPSDEVFRASLVEIAAPQDTTRFAARFFLKNFILVAHGSDSSSSYVSEQIGLLRKVLFSRSLRLLPLPHQIGVVEGLAVVVQMFSRVLSLSDQHMLAFVSELLKMASVADGEMSDPTLKDLVVDKNGYTLSVDSNSSSWRPSFPTHSSSVFHRRLCIIDVEGASVVVPEQYPNGVQLRVSSIVLFHSLIRAYPDSFFDAEQSSPIGNIRPHVISLLFRTLVSAPLKAVVAAHVALKDTIALSTTASNENDDSSSKPINRLPKELLQACIRPVLLNLRDYTRLSLPLLRGLQRLLALLSSWFNKTLGEKLLEHLQKWLDPSNIIQLKIWREGEEPFVAAAIVDVFHLLPNSSPFVEPLVKICIKLEACLPIYKLRLPESPFRQPLARFLDRHPPSTVAFFFQRLKSPIYSEIFQSLIQLESCASLRSYLMNKQSSMMILSYCFEKPLAIIRSEKNSGPGSSAATSLFVHGISKIAAAGVDASGDALRPMTEESLELQLQGFRLVSNLLVADPKYFESHNDIVRAFRWLWRSKGRFLRLQNEDLISPRFHGESKLLATFLMAYGESLPHDDFDILFELIRVFLQPSSADFGFVSRFLANMVSNVLTLQQKQHVMNRFISVLSGESSEETKVLSLQYLIYPMVSSHLLKTSPVIVTMDEANETSDRLIDNDLVERFVKDILFPGESTNPYGERLKVELLRLCNILVCYAPKSVQPFWSDFVKFCWTLLKCEDASCKGWAYLVVCRCVAAFDAPEKVARQSYLGLLRSHQPECRELVREALDVLVPSLPKKLSELTFRSLVDQAAKLLLEDGNSAPQLAHICQMIVRNPKVFFPFRIKFAGYLISSLSRLGLPPNSPVENRVLAVAVVELLLDWDAELPASDVMLASQLDSVANFLVRLKILLAEPIDNRASRIETSAIGLEARILGLLRRVLSLSHCSLKEQPFEKIVANDREAPGPLVSGLEILVELARLGHNEFITRSSIVYSDLVPLAFKLAKDDQRLREVLHAFIVETSKTKPVSRTVIIALERALTEANSEMKRSPSNRSNDSSSRQGRNRDRVSAVESAIDWAMFSLQVLSELCTKHEQVIYTVMSSLLAFAFTLTKSHLVEASSKQRHGPSLSPKVSSGIKNHTPTVGVIEAACSYDPAEASRPPHLRQRSGKDESDLAPTVRCLLKVLRLIESSDIAYQFTQNRKLYFQIIGNIADSSDSVYLLLGVIRIIVALLLSNSIGPPLTRKEKIGFQAKLGFMDYFNLSDDVSLQPVADLVCWYTEQLPSHELSHSPEAKKLLMACLMNAKARGSNREVLLSCLLKSLPSEKSENVLQQLMTTDFDCVGGRYWVFIVVETLLRAISSADDACVCALKLLTQGDIATCERLLQFLLPEFWVALPTDDNRLQLIRSVEALLSKPFHTQFFKGFRAAGYPAHSSNSCRSMANVLIRLNPVPVLDTRVLVHMAEYYSAWHEVTSLLARQLASFCGDDARNPLREETLGALRHCYSLLSEKDVNFSLASRSCLVPLTSKALSFDVYHMIDEAAECYMNLMVTAEEASGQVTSPTEFEMSLWEDRWVRLQQDLGQQQVVASFADASQDPLLKLENAWKSHDWTKVRSLLSSAEILPPTELGDPIVKISETLLGVAEGNIAEMENLHAQTAQLCLYKWQLLPRLSSGSLSHASLLHVFHRLVEIRESGQIMVEVSNHATGRPLPDLKNLLNAWRHRLPNDWEPISTWDEIFAWRSHMFNTITSKFHAVESNTLATMHDRPWSSIRMAKTARKLGLREVSLLVLDKTVEETAMNVSDAFFKLREQVLTYYNLDSERERHAGLNLINTTNLTYFDAPQKSELFRLKATFLSSLGYRSKANQAYCHSLQICSTHARAWESWGSLCSHLGTVAEKQLEVAPSRGDESKDQATKDPSKDPKAIAKKVAQYLAQAMGCYLEAINLNSSEWNRIYLSKVLWMLMKDGPTHGVLCQTLENRGTQLPGWVWLPWLPQLLTGLYRPEGRAVKSILSGLAKTYPQAIYYSLRVFYLERRDVERTKGSPSSGNQMASLAFVEELVSLLRRSHASLWSSLESVLEELLVKFRPIHEEELLSPVIALLERAESQLGSSAKREDEGAVASSIWKTLWKIAAKFFRQSEQVSNRSDERATKTALFKEKYRDDFERDFHVSSAASSSSPLPEGKAPLSLDEFVTRLRDWKRKLERNANPRSISMIDNSQTLAAFALADSPDLWPGCCDPKHLAPAKSEFGISSERDPAASQSSTSLSAAAAMNAALSAAKAVVTAALREGVGGDYGGGTSFIEIPGQYPPNASQWSNSRPSPELHPKLLRFEQSVQIIRRNDQLVRRIGMVGSDGCTYRFIVQAAVPFMTRTDERTAQVSRIVDVVLRRNVRSARANLSVQPHSVVPMAQRLRLVSEPDGRLSLEEAHREACDNCSRDASDLPVRFNDEVATAVGALDLSDLSTEEVRRRESEARLEVFRRIQAASSDDSSVLLRHIQSALGTPELVYDFRRTFAQQWATNCLLQYAFCVAERTPGRAVLVKSTMGGVLSPEFRISYNAHGFIESQQMPFRMTANLTNLIGFPLLEGHFVPSMANVAGAVREHKADLFYALRLLARDDLIAFYTRSMPKSDLKTQEMERQLADRVVKNAATVLSRIGECAPRHSRDDPTTTDPVDKRVRDLIAAARSDENLCQMSSSYQGWL